MSFSTPARPTIGILAGWQFYRTATNFSYLMPLFRGMNRAAQSLDCNLLIGCGIGPSASPSDPYRPAWPEAADDQDFVPIGPWNVHALIVAAPLHSTARAEYLQRLRAAGLPVLFIGSGEPGPTIQANNTAGIFAAVKHLVDHGRRRIAFLAGSPDDLRGDSGQRLNTFRQVSTEFGLVQDNRLIVYGRHVYDGGFASAQQILASGVEFDALIASNDESAIGAMDALQQAGRRIPEEIAVIGFDNRLDGAVHQPALTSVHVPLFDMGYQAVEKMFRHLSMQQPLADTTEVDTYLVIRSSCGCEMATPTEVSITSQQLSYQIAARIKKQAFDLSESETLALCLNLTDAFLVSRKSGSPNAFRAALDDALQRTIKSWDGAHIWQDAISLLKQSLKDHEDTPLVRRMLDEARAAISAQMQQQYRQFILNERWNSSRLSLLTARLLTVLEETQVYEILARYLPTMGIELANVVTFEREGDDPFAWSVLRNVLNTEGLPKRFRSQDYPPKGQFSDHSSYQLTLIPLVDQTGQIGFMVFDTGQLNLFGAIVQQLGSALNTARLYRQATEARQAAEEANRLKSRFLSTISHELRTPLNLVVGLSRLMLEEGDEEFASLPGRTRRDVERIFAYAQHLGGLINDVIDLTTSGAGPLRLQWETIDLNETLQIISESGEQLAQDKGLNWRTDFPDEPVYVWGDRTRLRQVALNLVSNAVKFTAHGEVCLKLSCANSQVRISVKDTGLGIPVDEQERIFEAFYRSERSLAGGYPGLGLGISISKTIIEMHGGQVGVDSSGVEGEGAEFWAVLPEFIVHETQLPSAIAAEGELNILLLFHSPADHGQLRERLHQQHIKLLEAPLDRPQEWQKLLAISPPQAIILEIDDKSNLPWRTMKMIKDLPSVQEIPVMFYSASAQGESLLKLDYLTKPIEPEALLRALDQNLTLAEPEAQTIRTFLVVDDDVNTLEMYARLLRLHSATNRVLAAQNGREALNFLLTEKVDLVLLDLQMPEMDGFAVLQAMHEASWTRNIPVIIITGKELTEEDLARLSEGVTVVLQKGMFAANETIAHINAVLERKRHLSMNAQRLVRMAMLYIHKNYAQPITRGEIARHINIAEDYLTSCFRQELGTTPIKYVQRYRILQAKKMLKETALTVTEIALAVGFSDSGYFSRVFHRETGLPPETYRRS